MILRERGRAAGGLRIEIADQAKAVGRPWLKVAQDADLWQKGDVNRLLDQTTEQHLRQAVMGVAGGLCR